MGLVSEGMTTPKSLLRRERKPWAVESGTYPNCWARSLMRVFVVGPTSGQSCNALETVMTETPAFLAMSLRRTIGQEAGVGRQEAGVRRIRSNAWLPGAEFWLLTPLIRLLLSSATYGAGFRRTNRQPGA